ncbi:hypothetical protein PM082_000562 [Marasmius tenuissimus]|nr:hypothetical protein PM082_000562 [Marasmius tenuissimus]
MRFNCFLIVVSAASALTLAAPYKRDAALVNANIDAMIQTSLTPLFMSLEVKDHHEGPTRYSVIACLSQDSTAPPTFSDRQLEVLKIPFNVNYSSSWLLSRTTERENDTPEIPGPPDFDVIVGSSNSRLVRGEPRMGPET